MFVWRFPSLIPIIYHIELTHLSSENSNYLLPPDDKGKRKHNKYPKKITSNYDHKAGNLLIAIIIHIQLPPSCNHFWSKV